jgi:antitoxin component of RelBE/YafQ-DinJ toxin-antitoxin module
MVTSRVPTEIKRQGNKTLESLGVTPSQAINALYRFIVEHGSLPDFRSPAQKLFEDRSRTFTPENMTPEMQRKLEAMRFIGSMKAECWGEYTDRPYREIIEEGRRRDYEALA